MSFLGDKYSSNTLSISALTKVSASLVASSSGTPVDINLFRGYSEKRQILPSTRTLGDILYDNGYNLKVVQGTEIEFAGIGQRAEF